MNKEKIAEKFLKTINLYSDYLEYGINKKHDIPDLSYLNINKTEKVIVKSEENTENLKKLSIKKNKIIEVVESIIHCNKCILYKNGEKIPGLGNLDAEIFVIGYPLTDIEKNSRIPMDKETITFFIKWLTAIQINFNDVFITNILKCTIKKEKIVKEYIEKCLNFIDMQLEIIKPKIILALGQIVLSSLKKGFLDIKDNHGKIFTYNNIPFLPTYHPAEVLKNPVLKKDVWEDLKKLKKFLNK